MLLFFIFLLTFQTFLLTIFVFFACFNYLYGIASFWRPNIRKITHSGKRIAVVIVSLNEKHVIEETIRSCDKLTYPNRIIILADDSNDPEAIERFRKFAATRGCKFLEKHEFFQEAMDNNGNLVKLPMELWESPNFVFFHRPSNMGFKAGCLKKIIEYLKSRDIDLMYLLDADWHPQKDVLERCIEVLEAQDNIAFVQTKRVTFRRGIRRFQKYIALIEEGCYYVDQEGRQVLGHPILFSGCCALLRLDVVDKLGGFTPGHLTEDLDLTDRFWVNGWKGIYLGNVVNYGEVPFNYDHFRRQQERWVVGTTRALREYFWRLLTTKHLNLFQKISAIRQNAYYTTSLFSTIALMVGAMTLLWLYIGRNTYQVEYYLYIVEKWRTPLLMIIYWCLLSNLTEIVIMITIKKRNYADLLHVPMCVWYAWSTLPTYVIGNLKGVFRINTNWFCTPKYKRSNVGKLKGMPNAIRVINYFLCIALICFFYFEGAIFGWVDIFGILWIPAFLLASKE
jgi:cellulose synthase/poly-beta-1,6-N-acetylglucosamine synthase-like glycosyltransferase